MATKSKTYLKKRDFLSKEDNTFYSTEVVVDSWKDKDDKLVTNVNADFILSDGGNSVYVNVWARDSKELKRQLESLYKVRDALNMTINNLLLAGKDSFK